MTDIIIRTSDGRVQQVADTITLDGDRYLVTQSGAVSHEPTASFGTPTSIVNGVTGVPSDLVGGWNYNYVSGAFTSSGVTPPAPPTPIPWAGCKAVTSTMFVEIVVNAIGAPAWSRIENDPAGEPIFAEIEMAGAVDPSSPTFAAALNYLTTTNGADNNKLLTSANVTAIIASWLALQNT